MKTFTLRKEDVERRWWLVDAGPRTARWDAGEGSVLPFLRWAGVRRLERLVVTHDDGDHTGGAFAVRRFTQPFWRSQIQRPDTNLMCGLPARRVIAESYA